MSTTPPPSPSRLDGLRFAFGTLSVLPVEVSRWDRETARGGMLSAPLVGVVIGGCAGLAGLLLLVLGASPLLAAVGTVAVPAVMTRGLHLDGLADTADGLGSGKPPADALRIMKQSDIGPFGVLSVVFVLFAQVAAVAQLYGESWGRGVVAAVVSATAARTALTSAAREGVPPARPEGLGAAVARVVPVRWALGVAGAVALGAGGSGALFSSYDVVRSVVAVVVALLAAERLLQHCVRRFGGVTGDVFGGLAETAGTATLVVLTFSF
ncbi:adenosylcobinamide-GDP ribazoletransferase [Streptomyces sp. NPDC047072]|uniref:adenosylcobinamide-GDP ribazoletransferase n=1 Tax=Streptomyces sp. NPDC047072 TaxID=3154809 RepID=UPI0033EDF26A